MDEIFKPNGSQTIGKEELAPSEDLEVVNPNDNKLRQNKR